MSYNILPTKRFEKELKHLAKKYPAIKANFANLVAVLMENPQTGTFLGNNCYKVRMSITGKAKGKSGGARVITYLYIQTETVYLLTAYDKSENDTIKDYEIREMIKSLDL